MIEITEVYWEKAWKVMIYERYEGVMIRVLVLKEGKLEFCWSSDQDWVQISNLFSNLKFDFLNEFLIKI